MSKNRATRTVTVDLPIEHYHEIVDVASSMDTLRPNVASAFRQVVALGLGVWKRQKNIGDSAVIPMTTE